MVIPSEYRKVLGMEIGNHMVIELQEGELRVRSRRAAITKVQALVRQYIRTKPLAGRRADRRAAPRCCG
jgi:antitoxin PrlF